MGFVKKSASGVGLNTAIKLMILASFILVSLASLNTIVAKKQNVQQKQSVLRHCFVDYDCPQKDNECVQAVCKNETCLSVNKPDGAGCQNGTCSSGTCKKLLSSVLADVSGPDLESNDALIPVPTFSQTTPTLTPTLIPISTNTPTPTPTITPTSAPASSTPTPTPIPTSTPVPTSFPVPTPTEALTPTPTPTPTEEQLAADPAFSNGIVLASGPQTYTISMTHNSPNFTEATINPLNVAVGDTQTMTAKINDTYPIILVEARVETDNGIEIYPLTLISGTNVNGVWQGSWVVHDTHLTTYRTTFYAINSNNETGETTLSWSDACTIPYSGTWTLSGPCTIAGNAVIGISGADMNLNGQALTLQADATFYFESGKTITMNGSLIKGSGASIRKLADPSYLYISDADSDGYPASATLYTSSGAGRVRRNTLTNFVQYSDGTGSKIDANDSSDAVYPGTTCGTAWSRNTDGGLCNFYNDGYFGYRKQIAITGAGSTQTNYQVKLDLRRATGSDTGYTVFVGDKPEIDYDDVRFTKSDGITPLDYWIESASESAAVVWVELDSASASATTNFYLYYDNPSAVASSSGTNTFVFFDDFDSANNTTKWDVTGSCENSGGIVSVLRTGGTDATLKSKDSFGTDTAVRYLAKGKYFANLGFDNGFVWYSTQYIWVSYSTYVSGYQGKYANYVSAWATQSIAGWTEDTYAIQDVIRNSTTSVIYRVNNADEFTQSSRVATLSMPISFRALYADTAEMDIEWVLVRTYTTTEPSWGAWGGEETLSNN